MNSSARDLEDAEKCPAEALVTLPQAKTAKTGLLEHGSQLMKVSCFQMNRSPSMGPEPLLLRKTSDAVGTLLPAPESTRRRSASHSNFQQTVWDAEGWQFLLRKWHKALMHILSRTPQYLRYVPRCRKGLWSHRRQVGRDCPNIYIYIYILLCETGYGIFLEVLAIWGEHARQIE